MQSHQRRRFRICTTDSKHAHPLAPNVLERNFAAAEPNRKWVADLTYVATDEGWLYVAIILDLFARKAEPGRLLHHSDRGSQYAAYDYRNVLRARGITVSMSRKADLGQRADGVV